ncbi:uncharacterized protein LOC133846463 [Drosophila sulfurigaster albostrigata]|uniref:uncharacterized protein LOC133846463 n=1 Tax=Drosophila sulfurigaster albostrigata TaxID=89887 RepID=UPI002D219481|nr:uncharacterized protein LOC133846463 [Drosophila sulfurigaster albostrigata]
MLACYLKFLLPLALLHSVVGRVLMMPKFYGQDSAIIVDTDKAGLQSKLNPKLQNAFYYNIPVYKFFKPGAMMPTTTTTTTTTPAPIMSMDEYPSDLLYIARNKLGLKRMDQLPSLSELGELLGTGNAEETIKYIRALTSNDQGISLMKAYLGALDYDQSGGEEDESEVITQRKYNEDDNDTDNNSEVEADYAEVPLQQPKLEREESSLMQRVNEFMQQYGMWSEETTTTTTTKSPTVLPHKPTLRPLPYHYPIPLRAATSSVRTASTTTSTTTAATPQAPMPPHLNSPKVSPTASSSSVPVAPHIQQLAHIANIPPAVLDTFLQQQPKLAELAKRVSRLPLVQQHSKAIDGQLLVAVKKALSQDESLKRLLATSQTLK